jgi:hypothetical protein
LKSSFALWTVLTPAGNVNTEQIYISLSQMADPTDQNTLITGQANGVDGRWHYESGYAAQPLGYQAYAGLFQDYVINGIKIAYTASVANPHPIFSVQSSAGGLPTISYPAYSCPCTLHRVYAPFQASDIPTYFADWGAMPFGRSYLLPESGASRSEKMYIKMNSLWGTRIKNRDRFVRSWADLTANIDPDAMANFAIGFDTPSNDYWNNSANGVARRIRIAIQFTVTYYVTAQAVYSIRSAPALAAAKLAGARVAPDLLGDPAETVMPGALRAAHLGLATDGVATALVGTTDKKSAKRSLAVAQDLSDL